MATLLSLFRTLATWIFTGLFWLPAFFIYILTFKKIPDRFVTHALHFWGKTALKILSIQLELVNSSTITHPRPRVIIVNHQSALDLLWTAAIAPPNATAIGKKEIIFIPIVNLVWWALNFIRIDRSNTAKAIASLEGVSEQLIKNRQSLIIAPEGTRSLDSTMLPFKKGAFYIAVKGKIPIFPVVVSKACDLLPKNKFLPKPGILRVQFLSPIETTDIKVDNINQLIETARQSMIDALAKIR